MTAPNRNTLWARPDRRARRRGRRRRRGLASGAARRLLTVAARTDDLRVFSQLDERSAAYFALGARRTGKVTPLICTSGTAAANYHPAVMEASEARVPCSRSQPTARRSSATRARTRPPIRRSCTVTPSGFIRICRSPPPTTARSARSLRTTVARAVGTAEGADPGPVHLNVPFKSRWSRPGSSTTCPPTSIQSPNAVATAPTST